MANSFEGMNTERAALIEEAVFPVLDALMLLEGAESEEGVSLGEINAKVLEIGSQYERQHTGMGLIPEALDQLEEEGDVVSLEAPVSSSRNGHMIGRTDWKTFRYRLITPFILEDR